MADERRRALERLVADDELTHLDRDHPNPLADLRAELEWRRRDGWTFDGAMSAARASVRWPWSVHNRQAWQSALDATAASWRRAYEREQATAGEHMAMLEHHRGEEDVEPARWPRDTFNGDR